MDAPDTILPAIHPGTPTSATVSYLLTVVRETDKAYLVRRSDVVSRDVWLPKSHVHISRENRMGGIMTRLRMPLWLYNKKRGEF